MSNCETFVTIAIVAFCSFVIGGSVVQKEAIQHKAAHYDPVTAEFMWNQ